MLAACLILIFRLCHFAAGKARRDGWSGSSGISSKLLGLTEVSFRSVLIFAVDSFWGRTVDQRDLCDTLLHQWVLKHSLMCMNITVCVSYKVCNISRVFQDSQDLQEPKELKESQWVHYLLKFLYYISELILITNVFWFGLLHLLQFAASLGRIYAEAIVSLFVMSCGFFRIYCSPFFCISPRISTFTPVIQFFSKPTLLLKNTNPISLSLSKSPRHKQRSS